MGRHKGYVPAGVIPATLLAFSDDFSIDEAETRRHLRHVAATRGISAITVNGHASEVACLQLRGAAAHPRALGGRGRRPACRWSTASMPTAASRRRASPAMAEEEGASALLVFPPNSMAAGGQLRPEMALAHFARIADATDLPIILFQYPAATGLGYPFDTLLRLVEAVPTIRAIKDWCADPMLHERHIRTLQALPRPVNVLTTHSSWLMAR